MSRAGMLNNRRSPSARNLVTCHAVLKALIDGVRGEEAWRKFDGVQVIAMSSNCKTRLRMLKKE